jgi:hypothetical protein
MQYETKEVKITYGLVSKRPHENNIAQAIRENGEQGWILIQRVDGEGLVDVVGFVYTRLIFQRPRQ